MHILRIWIHPDVILRRSDNYSIGDVDDYSKRKNNVPFKTEHSWKILYQGNKSHIEQHIYPF